MTPTLVNIIPSHGAASPITAITTITAHSRTTHREPPVVVSLYMHPLLARPPLLTRPSPPTRPARAAFSRGLDNAGARQELPECPVTAAGPVSESSSARVGPLGAGAHAEGGT
jgi:hypothetical protein